MSNELPRAASREQIEAHLQKRAAEDPAFRQMLLSNPREALKQETGLALPAKFEVNVVEESSDHLYLVLPAEHGELSDLELETMAGGVVHGSSQKISLNVNTGGVSIDPNTRVSTGGGGSSSPAPSASEPAPASGGGK